MKTATRERQRKELLAQQEELYRAEDFDDDEHERIQQKLEQLDERDLQSQFFNPFAEPAPAKRKAKPAVQKHFKARAEFHSDAAAEFDRFHRQRIKATEGKDREPARAEARRKAAFIQYPLALLFLYPDRRKHMDSALEYGCMYRARCIYRKAKEDDDFLRRLKDWVPDDPPEDYDPHKLKHKALVAAQCDVWVKGKIADQLCTWDEVRKELRKFGIDPDHTAFVRIPTRRAFGLRGVEDNETHDVWGDDVSQDEDDGMVDSFFDSFFLPPLNDNDTDVLQAIASKIGRKDFVAVKRKEIQTRATGAMDDKQWKSFGRPKKLSIPQVMRSIAKLAGQRGLVSRYVYRRGRGKGSINFFSLKLSPAELEEKCKELRQQAQGRKRPARACV